MKGNEELSKNPVFEQLIKWLEEQSREISDLKAEVQRLKGHPVKPNIKANARKTSAGYSGYR